MDRTSKVAIVAVVSVLALVGLGLGVAHHLSEQAEEREARLRVGRRIIEMRREAERSKPPDPTPAAQEPPSISPQVEGSWKAFARAIRDLDSAFYLDCSPDALRPAQMRVMVSETWRRMSTAEREGVLRATHAMWATRSAAPGEPTLVFVSRGMRTVGTATETSVMARDYE